MAGRGGRGVGGWASYHLMLPFVHNPALSNAAKVLMKLRSRTIEGRKERRRSSMQSPDKAGQSIPVLLLPSPSLFSRLAPASAL